MKNADSPAAPTPYMDLNSNGGELYCDNNGLTKREMFAMHAMQGLLSSNAIYNGKTDRRDLLASDALAHADALLKELSK